MDRAQEDGQVLGFHNRVALAGLVLQDEEDVEKEGGQQEEVGVHPLQEKGEVEVRAVSQELLLLQGVPECGLAPPAQAPLLQTRQAGSVNHALPSARPLPLVPFAPR